MISSKAYLFKAFYNWLVDNKLTPYFKVNAIFPGVEVPALYVRNQEIVLDASPSAVKNFIFNTEKVSFDAAFRNVPHTIFFPIQAIIGLCARENAAFIAADFCEVLDVYAQDNVNELDILHPVSEKEENIEAKSSATPRIPPYLRIVEDDAGV